jgi:hypothetical protein
MDTIERVPQTSDKGIYVKQKLKDKLVEESKSTSTAKICRKSGTGSGAIPSKCARTASVSAIQPVLKA